MKKLLLNLIVELKHIKNSVMQIEFNDERSKFQFHGIFLFVKFIRL